MGKYELAGKRVDGDERTSKIGFSIFHEPGLSEPALECADQLERAIKYEGPDGVAGFIAEPVVGATAGALVPRDGYRRRIRAICDAYDVKLIADEVMTGVGRRGHNFCLDHWRTAPGVIVTAKGLGSGCTPLGAVVVTSCRRRPLSSHGNRSTTWSASCGRPL